MLKALVFDVDGTLAETEELHRTAFNEAFGRLGLPWRWDRDLYGELLAVTGGKERIAHFLATHRPGGPELSPGDIAALHRLKTEIYGRSVDAGALPLRPGVRRLVAEAARAGVRLAVATTTSRSNVVALLRTAFPGEAPFAAIAAGDEVPRKKPAPDIYERALALLGLEPAECVAFEDSANGVAAARGAGLPVVATPSAFTAGENLSGAVSIVSDLGDPGAPHVHLAGATWPDGMVTLAALRSPPPQPEPKAESRGPQSPARHQPSHPRTSS